MAHARTLLTGILAIVVLPLVALPGCGGSHGGAASCAVATPCGGDLVGTWLAARGCSQSSTTSSCTASSTYQPYLTYVFRADGTFTLSVTGMGSYSSTYNTSCFCDGGATCAQLDDLVKKSIESPDASLSGGGCQESGEACQCTFDYRLMATYPISGTYRTDGSTLRLETTTAAGAATDSAGYCVSGSSLHLIRTPSADGGSSSGTFDIVLVRQ